MSITIYFDNIAVILCSDIDKVEKDNKTLIIEAADILLIQNLLKKIEEKSIEKAILFYKDFDALKKMFFSLFTPIEAAGGIVENENKEILFIYRLSKWDLPKGKIEENENSQTAAIREVEEETGLKNLTLKNKISETYHTYKAYGKYFIKTTHWFYMTCSAKQVLQPQVEENIEKVVWVDRAEIKDLMENTYPSVRDIMEGFYIPQQEIYFDSNSRMTENGYMLVSGSMDDLKKMNLTLEQAKGKRFTFYMTDFDLDGKQNDLMFDGILIYSDEYGYLAERESEFYWRNDKAK